MQYFWLGLIVCPVCGHTWKAMFVNDTPEFGIPVVPCEKCGEHQARRLGGQVSRWFSWPDWMSELPRLIQNRLIPLTVLEPAPGQLGFDPLDSVWFLPDGTTPKARQVARYEYRRTALFPLN